MPHSEMPLGQHSPKEDKVKYVKGQGQFRQHHCHWPGCTAQVPPAMWGCRKHWFTLPKHLRDAIWTAYNPGQEVSVSPSRDYLSVAREVQEWIQQYIKAKGDVTILESVKPGPIQYKAPKRVGD